MVWQAVIERFEQQAPASVMARLALEQALPAHWIGASASAWATARSLHRAQTGQRGDITCVMKRGLVGYGVARLAEKFDTVIVDAGGQDSVELRQAIAVCDYLLIPVRPSQWDVWSLNNMAALVDEVASKTGEKINAHVVLNACSTNRSVKEADEVRSLIVTE